MKPISILAFTACTLLAACSKTSVSEEQQTITPNDEIATKAKSSGQATDINFTVQNLFPEGVVYDKYNDRFYVSSTSNGDIGIVTKDGPCFD